MFARLKGRLAVPALVLPSVANIEHLFGELQPTDLRGQPFVPALHPLEIIADDSEPASTEDEAEVVALDAGALGPFTEFTSSDVPLPMVAIDAGVLEVG